MDKLTIGLAQIAPVWLDRVGTLSKMLEQVQGAKEMGRDLVTFEETLLFSLWENDPQLLSLSKG